MARGLREYFNECRCVQYAVIGALLLATAGAIGWGDRLDFSRSDEVINQYGPLPEWLERLAERPDVFEPDPFLAGRPQSGQPHSDQSELDQGLAGGDLAEQGTDPGDAAAQGDGPRPILAVAGSPVGRFYDLDDAPGEQP
ncbi:MAG: hypothetical protein ACTHLZ_09570 [Tepidisphaeraceae bacterium]